LVQKSRKQNLRGALCSLGFLYEKSLGEKADIFKAVKFYYATAQQDHPGAQVALGTMHATGKGLPKDLSMIPNSPKSDPDV
jgi:TPR repeat protein